MQSLHKRRARQPAPVWPIAPYRLGELSAHWPGPAGLFARLDCPIALAFLKRYPTPWAGLLAPLPRIGSISATTTTTGLTVHCVLDTAQYPTGIKYTTKDVDALPITRHDFHGEWNYAVQPDTPAAA